MNEVEILMQECNNYFYKTYEHSTFAIQDGIINSTGKYLVGQYIKIEGSILNDGVYKIESMNNNKINITELSNEVFEGCIYGLSVPKGFIELSTKIKQFIDDPKAKITNLTSESFNNYSYSRGSKQNGANITWNDIFIDDIRSYKSLYDNKRRCKEIDKFTIVTSLNGGTVMTANNERIGVI